MSEINIGQISEALNDKIDRDGQNVDNNAGADIVIEFQLPTAENDHTWYRKYKSGWVEQGGTFSTGGSGNKTVNLPITIYDTSYWIQVSRQSGASTTSNVNVWSRTPTSESQFVIYSSDDTGVKWEVRGVAAS